MVCIICGETTHIINSRRQVRLNSTWRRRKCEKCHAIFTTIESADLSSNWLIDKENGVLEPFLQEKLFLSIYESCRHRMTAIEDSKYLTTNVIAQLKSYIKNGVIKTRSITNTTGTALNRFDNVAAVHYLAFHKTVDAKK